MLSGLADPAPDDRAVEAERTGDVGDVTRQSVTRIESGELALGPELFTEVHAAVTEVTGPATVPGIVLPGSWLFGIGHAWQTGCGTAS